MKAPAFPLRVRFSDGQESVYEDEHDVACNLEFFDSDRDGTVIDARGRRVHLVVRATDILKLALAEPAG